MRLLMFVFVTGLTLGGSAARAADVTRTTDAGKEVLVRRHVSLDAGCGGSMPTIDITQAPAHGKVDVRPDRFTLQSAFASRTDCIGRQVDGAAVWYIPAAGYHGPDSFTLMANYGGKGKTRASVTDNVQVTIK